MEAVQLVVGQGAVHIPELMGVNVQVKIHDGTGHKLAVQGVVGAVDCPDAPVSIGVAVGASAEGSVWIFSQV